MASSSPDECQLKPGPLIGKGLTSEVFAWGEDRVLKLFLPWRPKAAIQKEFSISQAVHAAGVPAPAVFEIVQIGGRSGIVFERVRGHSLLAQVERRPWTLFAAARQLAELHAGIHARAAPAGLPAQREQTGRWIEDAEDFTVAQKQAAREQLARLPAGDSLCHGDFHPANIILTAHGPVIIDWSGATRGHHLGDVARTSVLFETASLPLDVKFQIRIMMLVARRLLHATYLSHYLERRPGTVEEIERWRVIQRMAGSAWRAATKAAMAKAANKGIE